MSRLYQVERAGNGGKDRKTHSKAVVNEHERRARQPEGPVDDCVPRSVGVPAGRRPESGECYVTPFVFRQIHLISISNVCVQPTLDILYSIII